MQLNLFLSLTGTSLASGFLLMLLFIRSRLISIFCSMYITATSNKSYVIPLDCYQFSQKNLAGKNFYLAGGSNQLPSFRRNPTRRRFFQFDFLSTTTEPFKLSGFILGYSYRWCEVFKHECDL